MKHHGHLVAERLQIVGTDIISAHVNLPLTDIIETADQVHQTGLGTSGTADDADGLAGFNLQSYILEHRRFRRIIVTEIHIIKTDAAVRNLHKRFLGIFQCTFFFQDLINTLRAGHRHGDHDHDHGKHHKAHKDLHAVGQQLCKVSGGEFRLVAVHDDLRAHPAYHQDTEIHGSLHQRRDGCHQLLCTAEDLVDHAAGDAEFFLLMLFTYKALHHANAGDVLLYALIHFIVLRKCFAEDLRHLRNDDACHKDQEHNGSQVDKGHLRTDGEGHRHADDQIGRRAGRHTKQHLICILHVRHIRGETRHQTGGGELIDICEGIGLNVAIHGPPQISRETG